MQAAAHVRPPCHAADGDSVKDGGGGNRKGKGNGILEVSTEHEHRVIRSQTNMLPYIFF